MLLDLYLGTLADDEEAQGDLFRSCSALPHRVSLAAPSDTPSSSAHELLLVDTQGIDHEGEEQVSAMCKLCKYHFVFNIKRGPQTCGSPGFDNNYMLCHLVLTGSTTREPEVEDKLYPVTCSGRWKCSAIPCSMEVEVTVSQPRLKADLVYLIIDEERINRQRQQCLAEDPERFTGLSRDLERKSLNTIGTYLRDILITPDPAKSKKKVAVRNKIFTVQFGPSCAHVFEYLGFGVQEIDGEEFLILPEPAHFPGLTQVGSERAFYEDARIEVIALLEESARSLGALPPLPTPALNRLEHALGCHKHGHTARPKPQDNAVDFHMLGTKADSDDSLLAYAYQCQTQTNPTNKKKYLDALQNLASGRTDDLQMYVATQASLNDTPQFTSSDPILQAYAHFHLSPDGYEDNGVIIRQYETFCSQAPSQKPLHRQMLFRIGKQRESEMLQDIACASMDFHEACQFLDIADMGNSLSLSTDVLFQYAEAQMMVRTQTHTRRSFASHLDSPSDLSINSNSLQPLGW
jgi:ubiquitin carboxyl-terminal hydrolase 25/28